MNEGHVSYTGFGSGPTLCYMFLAELVELDLRDCKIVEYLLHQTVYVNLALSIGKNNTIDNNKSNYTLISIYKPESTERTNKQYKLFMERLHAKSFST